MKSMDNNSKKKQIVESLDVKNTFSPSRRRSTVLQAIGGYVNTGINVVQGLLLVPLFLKYIGSHTYGLWLASGGILGMLALMNFGVGSMLIQKIAGAYGKNDLVQAGMYFINGMVVYVFISLLLGMVGWGVSLWLPVILTIKRVDVGLLQKCFQVAVLAMVFGVLNECLRSFSQALLRPVVPVISIAFGRITGIGVTIWMLFDNFGLWAIPVGALFTELLTFTLNLLNAGSLLRKLKIRSRLKFNIIKEYFRTAPVLLMATAGNTLSQQADPLLITMFLGPEVTTVYMVTRRAADIAFHLLNVIIGSTMSSFSHLAGSRDIEKTKSIVKKLLLLSFSMGAIGFSIYNGSNQVFVTLWVGESFVLDQNIILFIGLGFFARTFRGLLGQILFGLGDFTYTSTVILSEGIARIVLAMFMLNLMGIIGVPLAFFASCIVSILVLGLHLKKELKMPVSFFNLGKLILSGVIVFIISFLIVQHAKACIDSSFGFILYIVLLMSTLSITYILLNSWNNIVKIIKF